MLVDSGLPCAPRGFLKDSRCRCHFSLVSRFICTSRALSHICRIQSFVNLLTCILPMLSCTLGLLHTGRGSQAQNSKAQKPSRPSKGPGTREGF